MKIFKSQRWDYMFVNWRLAQTASSSTSSKWEIALNVLIKPTVESWDVLKVLQVAFFLLVKYWQHAMCSINLFLMLNLSPELCCNFFSTTLPLTCPLFLTLWCSLFFNELLKLLFCWDKITHTCIDGLYLPAWLTSKDTCVLDFFTVWRQVKSNRCLTFQMFFGYYIYLKRRTTFVTPHNSALVYVYLSQKWQ